MEILELSKSLNLEGSKLHVIMKVKTNDQRNRRLKVDYSIKDKGLFLSSANANNLSSGVTNNLLKSLHRDITYQSLILQNGREYFKAIDLEEARVDFKPFLSRSSRGLKSCFNNLKNK